MEEAEVLVDESSLKDLHNVEICPETIEVDNTAVLHIDETAVGEYSGSPGGIAVFVVAVFPIHTLAAQRSIAFSVCIF